MDCNTVQLKCVCVYTHTHSFSPTDQWRWEILRLETYTSTFNKGCHGAVVFHLYCCGYHLNCR